MEDEVTPMARRKLNGKLLLWVAAALLVAATGMHLLHAYQSRQNARSLRERAERAAQQGRPQQAFALYDQYLQYEPDDLEAQKKFAELLDRHAPPGGQRSRMIQLAERVLEQADDEELRLRLVHNLIAQQRLSDALHHMKLMVERQPQRAELQHMLGWCYDADGNVTEAVAALREALRLEPRRVGSAVLLSELLAERQGQAEAAAEVMDALVRANPEDYKAHLARYRFRAAQRDARAGEDLALAGKLAADEPEVILAVAERAAAHGERDQAQARLRQGVERHPEHEALAKALAELEAAAGRKAEAVAVLSSALDKQPSSTALHLLYLEYLLDLGPEYDALAVEALDRLRAVPVAPALRDYMQARLDLARERWVRALPLLERARDELGPRSVWAGRVLGLIGACQRQAGDAEAAVVSYRDAVAADPGRVSLRVGLGATLTDAGRPDEAVAVLEPLRRAVELPRDYWVTLGRALLWRNLRLPPTRREWGEIEEAVVKSSPGGRVDGVLLGAEMRAARGDLPGARQLLDAALQKATQAAQQAQLWCALADVAYRQQREGEAEQLLQGAEKALGDRIEVRAGRARLWSMRGNSSDRYALLGLEENLSAFQPEDRLRLLRELAEGWQRLGESAQASRVLTAIAREQPADLRSRFALVELALESSKEAEVRRLIAELRKVEGNGPLARYAEAALKVRQAQREPAKLIEARKELDELARKHGKWGRVPLLLARIDEKERQTDRAVQHYLEALERGEARPTMIRRLLELLLERRDYPRAEEAFMRYGQQQPLTRDLIQTAAEIALGNGNPKQALERARLATLPGSRDYRDPLWLARIEERAGDLKGAEAHLREALGLADYVPEVWIALAAHHAAAGHVRAAEPLLAELQQKLPPDDVPLTLARCRDALRQTAQADSAYQKALAARPTDAGVIVTAAEFYDRLGSDDQVEALWRRLLEPQLKATPEYLAHARRRLAVLLAGRDLDSGREAHRAEALALLDANRRQLGPNPVDDRLRLFVRGSAAVERSAALDELETALRRQSARADDRVLLARLYEAEGKLAPAREQLMQALSLETRPARVLVRLVGVLIRNEELTQAESYLARLEALEPGSTRVAALRESLRQAAKSAKRA
jgi:predicted Zn-dependent protease